jgi:surfactin synthase thioesterase subunit
VQTVGERWGFIPQEAMTNNGVLDIMLPALRADIGIWEKYSATTATTNTAHLMTVPILALGGSEDTTCTQAELETWRSCTASHFQLEMVANAGHFHPLTHTNQVIKIVQAALFKVITEAPLAVQLGRQSVRCAFSDRISHSRMPLDPTHVRLKLWPCV